MRKRRACQVVARRLGLNVNRVAALSQRASEAGLLPVATGSDRPHLTNLEFARLLICAVADDGLGKVPTTVRSFAALEGDGLQFVDWLEGAISGRVCLDGLLSIVFQLEPPACAVITGSAQMEFGQRADNHTTRVTAISGEALRNIVSDFQNDAWAGR
ncbi:hypothetical protein AS156_27765 [Bradyrhizobium macuxiense]|uniref:Uncharacterized protein n=1 Tax=Bradyrhizobium macuxiense TaxID=1755647 RepID=A0A109K597_9BRAD|nr:hypothetical protein [Bradyrhizobium macuxiense]KWV60833.1 hypothetical protein AS156_27765 [Bradyrhizobium macuxiense]